MIFFTRPEATAIHPPHRGARPAPDTGRESGFTLIEMAIVVAIMAFLLGGLLAPLSAQKENQRRAENLTLLNQAVESLYGFAVVNGRLPCPDTDADGLEDMAGCQFQATATNSGDLPAATLGIQGFDAWGVRLRYIVNGAFASDGVGPNPPLMTLATQGNGNGILRIFNADAGAFNCNNAGNAAENVPALVWSTAKTLYGSANETENSDADRCFVTGSYNTTAGNELDDQVAWLSSNVLFNRMVAAGTLP